MRVDVFDHIVSREWTAILNFINASMRDRDVAEDLTQECFWRAYQGWPDFRGDCCVQTWLRQIARNVIRNFLRTKKAHLVWLAASFDEVLEASLIDHTQPSPEAVALHRESVTRIWAAADAISPKQQIAMRRGPIMRNRDRKTRYGEAYWNRTDRHRSSVAVAGYMAQKSGRTSTRQLSQQSSEHIRYSTEGKNQRAGLPPLLSTCQLPNC